MTLTLYAMFCAIWCHLYNLITWEILLVLFLVKLQAWLLACNFTKSNTPPWAFFTFFKWYNWYQIAQNTYRNQSFKLKYRHNLTFRLNYFAMHFRKMTCHTQYTSYSPCAHFYNFVPLFLIFHQYWLWFYLGF